MGSLDGVYEIDLGGLARQEFLKNASAGLAIASQIAGLFGAAENAISNKRSQEYLETMAKDIQDIRVSLSKALEKLDNLPTQFRNIVREEVNLAQLKECYIELESLLLRFFVEESGNKLTEIAARRLDYNLLFICNSEGRLSYMLNFVRACEIAMLLSNGKHLNYVVNIVRSKIDLIEPLQTDILSKVNEKRFALLALLKDKSYIERYTIDMNTYSTESISYTPKPDRPTTKTVTVSKPIFGYIYEGEVGDGPGCKNPPPKKIVIDYKDEKETQVDQAGVVFNAKKREHLTSILASKNSLTKILEDLLDINSVISFLNYYLNFLQKN
ncbi:hypothetical protein [Desulfoluna spongiiphila]|uniref:Uncharacterized protein n=1 Tax=Desulfoluna spongiiphila TaxID=419481 RepID=A0A1G5JRL7_9BACT|nr:hypothetical protein [Desulfoluna spongiiphila]SCY90977.1 hypothetical protein SAMN05216233_1432 [Desulfoluna spongiiphila]